MKTIIIFFLFFTITYAQTLTIAVGKDIAVHTMSKQVLQVAYSKIGIEPQFISMQLNEALLKLDAGDVDGDVSRIKQVSDKFPNIIQVPIPINNVEAVAFGKSKTMHINNWKDLESYKFTIVKGTKFIDYATIDMNKTIVYDYKKAFKNLNNNVTELVVVPKKSGLIIIKELGLNNINIVSSTLEHHNLYHVLHKRNIDLVEKLVPVLEEMKQSGQIKYIHQTYHLYK